MKIIKHSVPNSNFVAIVREVWRGVYDIDVCAYFLHMQDYHWYTTIQRERPWP